RRQGGGDRDASGSSQDLRGLPRDRGIAGLDRGGRMSDERMKLKTQAPPAGIFGRGPMGGFGMPVQKAKDFKGTLRRLSGYLRPHQAGLIVVIAAGVISTLFSVVGAKLLGKATTR